MGEFFEVVIQPADGFGEFQCSPINGEGWAADSDLLAECEGNVGVCYRLGHDELPAGCDDIRGRIRGEPASVYAYAMPEGGFGYFGIVEVSVADVA